jgi:sporulation protein YlmC with PRC-barrel domain
MTPTVLSSSTLTGDKIVNLNDEDLGTLKEIMIDVASGDVAYGVLSRGGLAGMGEKLFAVPWRLLTVDGEKKRLILNVDEAILEDSPGFDPDNWPTFDLEWQEGLHRHFGVDPYWEPTPPLT